MVVLERLVVIMARLDLMLDVSFGKVDFEEVSKVFKAFSIFLNKLLKSSFLFFISFSSAMILFFMTLISSSTGFLVSVWSKAQ